jgi:hypothetical protein
MRLKHEGVSFESNSAVDQGMDGVGSSSVSGGGQVEMHDDAMAHLTREVKEGLWGAKLVDFSPMGTTRGGGAHLGGLRSAASTRVRHAMVGSFSWASVASGCSSYIAAKGLKACVARIPQ